MILEKVDKLIMSDSEAEILGMAQPYIKDNESFLVCKIKIPLQINSSVCQFLQVSSFFF